jgi:hypothetical protein
MTLKIFLPFLFLVILVSACVPREQVVLRGVDIREVLPGKDGNPLLKANAVFFNPNSSRMRLKRIDIDVLVDGKKAARVDQHLSALIKANAEFTVPLEVQLNLKEGLLDTILSLFGGKKHEIQFVGTMKVTVNGFPVKVPLNYKEEIKL